MPGSDDTDLAKTLTLVGQWGIRATGTSNLKTRAVGDSATPRHIVVGGILLSYQNQIKKMTNLCGNK